ncbi:MAG: hypothetical protein F7C07_03135 [Desulfurococcales archaeon]|nr:hypothetical protein [Desulfurococcales archaeon]
MSGEERPLEERLRELLASMKDWERKPIISIGSIIVELVKLPKRELKRGLEPEKLAIHVRMKDAFKGVIVENEKELEDLAMAVQNRKVREVARALEAVNEERKVVEYSL